MSQLNVVFIIVCGMVSLSMAGCGQIDSVVDSDGNEYETVQIGNQVWTASNLITTRLSDGTPIDEIADPEEWVEARNPAYSWYDGEVDNREYYGALYNWYAVETEDLCPVGWRVPGREDWQTLIDHVSEDVTRLKSCRQIGSPEGDGCDTREHPRWTGDVEIFGTDDYGFAGLPGGFRTSTGMFTHLGQLAGWWTASEVDSEAARYKGISFNYIYFVSHETSKRTGMSVRCIRNE